MILFHPTGNRTQYFVIIYKDDIKRRRFFLHTCIQSSLTFVGCGLEEFNYSSPASDRGPNREPPNNVTKLSTQPLLLRRCVNYCGIIFAWNSSRNK